MALLHGPLSARLADGDLRAGFCFRRALLFVASPASLRRIQGVGSGITLVTWVGNVG
jgi:hypothetical protein